MANYPGYNYKPVGMYEPRYTERIIDLLGRAPMMQGAIWGQAVRDIGNITANAVAQHQERKDEQKRAQQFDAAIRQWDPADPMPFYRSVAVAYGPKFAAESVRAFAALEESKQRDAPDPKLFQTKAQYLSSLWKKNPDWVRRN